VTGEKPEALLLPQDIKPSSPHLRVRGVFNPAAVRLPNGKILLMARIAETPMHGERYYIVPKMVGGPAKSSMVIEKIPRSRGVFESGFFITKWGMWRLPTISHFRKIVLEEDGMKVESLNQKSDFCGCSGDGDFGVEDPRITFLNDRKLFAMAYVSVSDKSGVSTSLALSKDLFSWKRQGIIFSQQNKDVTIFPEKFNGLYFALHRPEGTMIFDKPSIWVSYSKDLVFWGREKPLLSPREKGWDSLRIGSGAPPIKTSEGFLAIYHGVSLKNNADPKSKVYRAGALLFDPKNPEKIVAQTPAENPLFSPELKCEKYGFVNNVVFPTGAVKSKDGKSILIYSGGADSSITVRKMNIKKILNSLHRY